MDRSVDKDARGLHMASLYPSDLAYGEVGAGMMIGPNAVIICDLELLAVR